MVNTARISFGTVQTAAPGGAHEPIGLPVGAAFQERLTGVRNTFILGSGSR